MFEFDLSNKNILVTGGLGFIGSNFIQKIWENSEEVEIVNFDKEGHGSSHDNIRIKSDDFGYQWWNVDLIHEIEEIDFYYGFKFDYIFHFAAESHVDRSIDGPVPFIHNNVMSTVRLLEAVRKYSPESSVIIVSTDEVFGHLGMDDDPFTEDSNLAPRSPYSASKASSDLIALAYHETYGLDVRVTRCCNNFGPNQYDEKFIPTVIRSLAQDKKIPVYGNGKNVREWIHVDDHNKQLLEVAKYGESGKTYNIGSGVELSNLQLISRILDIVDPDCDKRLEDVIEFVEDRKGHDFRYAIKRSELLKDIPLKDFDKSLEETVNFYLKKYE